MERKTKGNIMMLELSLIVSIVGIIVTVIGTIVTIISIRQSIHEDKHQKSDRTQPK